MKTLRFFLAGMLILTVAAVLTSWAATEDEIEASIEKGLEWLVDQQDSLEGFWGYYERVSYTGFAVVKLEDRAFELGYESPFDPGYEYHLNVITGLNYIFGQAKSDGGGGIYFENEWGEHESYTTGIALMAISASNDPFRLVMVGNPVVDSLTYLQVVQGGVNFFVSTQNPDGGWRYYGMSESDNSNTGYATLGLRYAEDFGCTIPQSLKNNLSGFIGYIQCNSGDPWHDANLDGGSGYDMPCDWVNLLKTGNLLFEMAFVGDDLSTQRVIDAIDYIERQWNDPSVDPGWKGGGWWITPHFQAMYCLMKGFESLNIETIWLDDTTEVDWFAEMADSIVLNQNDDGSWPYDYWGDELLSTVWALLTLEKVAPPPPVIEVAVDIKPTSCPNPLNVTKRGVIPVAVLGTEDFDVTQIDPASVCLEGVPPLRWSLEDVATPYVPYVGKEDCMDCTTEGPDRILDLTLKFDAQAVVDSLGEVEDRECRVLEVTGNLTEEFGGTGIKGEDVMRIQISKKKGKKAVVPMDFALFQNAPNPFNPTTEIGYALAEHVPVRLVVYNLLGQSIVTLVDEPQTAGYHTVAWDASEHSSGMYFYRLEAGSFTVTKMMVLMK